MNSKELRAYKERLAQHETPEQVSPCVEYGIFGGANAYLNGSAVKELRKDVKTRNGFQLKGCGFRATVRKTESGYILTSYYTDVAEVIENETGYTFKKLWVGYSVTTLKHVNAFRELFGMQPLSKHEWVML